MMKKIVKHIGFVAILLVTACGKDFIELSPVSQMNENDFYKTEEDFQIALNAVYQSLHVLYAPESGVSYFAEQMSDNATLLNVAGNTTERYAFKDFNLLPDNDIVLQIWDNYYQSIYKANNVISKLEKADIVPASKNRLLGELKFLRGLFYFNLVRMFGPLPVVEKPVSVEESYSITRSPEADVYELIISDLQFAAENLPLQSQIMQPGRASKGAAYGFLGKVYQTVGDEENAKAAIEKVINSDEYTLLDEYSWLWDLNHENSREALFEIQFKGGAVNPSSSYWPDFVPFENFSLTIRGGGMNVPTEDIYMEFEANDPRRELSMSTGYYDRGGNFVDIPYIVKWVDKEAEVLEQSERCENNFIVLRYADILLMYAQLTGDTEYLNKVRRRAGLPEWSTPGYPSSEYYSNNLQLAIEHERRVELAFEFHRFFDLKRTGMAVEILAGKGKAITESDLYLPIPQSVIDQNPAIEQNEGY